MSRSIRTRLVTFAAALLVAGLAACENDPLSGPAKIVGDVLLDLVVTPAAVTIPPSGSVAISGGTCTTNCGTATPNRDTLTVTLNNLAPLPAGWSYQVLLGADSAIRAGVDAGLNHLRPVSGRIIRIRRAVRPVNRDSVFTSTVTDTTGATVPTAVPLVLTGTDTNHTYVMRIVGVPQGDSTRKYTHVVVMATASPLTSSVRVDPTQRMGFLYAMFRDTKNTVLTTDDTYAGANFTIGSFAVNRSRVLRFSTSASVNGAIRGRDIRINYRGLTRPPEGMRYASWLIDGRTGAQVRLGELRTPEPGSVSLADADISSAAYLTPDGIVNAEVRANADALGIEFDDFTRYALVLEAKGPPPARAPGWEIMAGQIPQSVANRHPTPGVLTGVVTSTSGAPVLGTTLYLTGVGLTNTLIVTNAAADGKYKFRTVNVGSYTLHVIPKNGTVEAANAAVTIGTHKDAAGATRGDSVNVNVTIP